MSADRALDSFKKVLRRLPPENVAKVMRARAEINAVLQRHNEAGVMALAYVYSEKLSELKATGSIET